MKTTAKKRSVRSRPASRWRISPIMLGAVLLTLVAGVIIYAIWQTVAVQNEKSRPITGVATFTPARGHQAGKLTYDQTPPVGGIHNPVWQNCGVYTAPITNENGVHSLEHGAIWLTYQPDLSADQVAQLQTLTRQNGYRLLSPYPGLPTPIVASAWGYQLKIEQANDPRLPRFIQRYEQNPQGPEPGAPCSGGVGAPS